MVETIKFDLNELNFHISLLFIWTSFLTVMMTDLSLLYIGMMGLSMIDMYIEDGVL